MGGIVRRSLLVVALVVGLISGLVPAASAAVRSPDWGTGGVASFPIPAGTSIADTAWLPDGESLW